MFVNTKSRLFSYCATIVNFSTFKTLRLLSEKNGEDVSLVHRRSRGEYRISVGQRRTKGETTAAKKANEKEVVAVDVGYKAPNLVKRITTKFISVLLQVLHTFRYVGHRAVDIRHKI